MIFFIFLLKNIDCGYKEQPRPGGSNEYPLSMFLSRRKKNNVYPCKPQFYYKNMGFKGSKLYRRVFVVPRQLFHLSSNFLIKFASKCMVCQDLSSQRHCSPTLLSSLNKKKYIGYPFLKWSLSTVRKEFYNFVYYFYSVL